MDTWLDAYLKRGEIKCPACAKPLRLREGSCCSCRKPIMLGLAALEFYQLAWGVLLTGLGAMGGIGCFFDTLVIHEGRLPSPRDPRNAFFLSLAVLGPVAMIVLVLAISMRRRFFKWTPAVQWLTALFACGVFLGILFGFVLVMKR